MLELRGVGFRYARSDWVFRGVSFSVLPGTATAVLGPNGRGKTTLVRCAAGLLQGEEGDVRREGPVGFVPQARGSAFAYPVREMVLMGRVAQVGVFSVPGRRDRLCAAAAIERVGIGHLADRPFPSLSGGEQQLVLIARAVASGSPTLVLDEPATGLDLRNQAQILALIRSLVAEGLAVLLTTHHPDHALHVCDRVVLMHGTTDVRCGPALDLLQEAGLSELYGVPVRRAEVPGDSGERGGRVALVTGYAVPAEGIPAVSPAPRPGRSARARR